MSSSPALNTRLSSKKGTIRSVLKKGTEAARPSRKERSFEHHVRQCWKPHHPHFEILSAPGNGVCASAKVRRQPTGLRVANFRWVETEWGETSLERLWTMRECCSLRGKPNVDRARVRFELSIETLPNRETGNRDTRRVAGRLPPLHDLRRSQTQSLARTRLDDDAFVCVLSPRERRARGAYFALSLSLSRARARARVFFSF